LIEPADREGGDKLLGAESLFPSKAASASIGRRALAALVDGAILATALAGFAAIFFRLNPVREALPQFSWKPLAAAFAGSLALWAGYEFLFAVYTGSTPGLRAARLQLASFDGAPVPRRCAGGGCWRRFCRRFPWTRLSVVSARSGRIVLASTASRALTSNRSVAQNKKAPVSVRPGRSWKRV